MTKEPDKIPAVDIDDGEAQHIVHLIDVIDGTRDMRPQLKALHDAALMQLVELNDAMQVKLDEWAKKNKERDEKIAKALADEAEAQRLKEEQANKAVEPRQRPVPSSPTPERTYSPPPPYTGAGTGGSARAHDEDRRA
jgi:hypothetical protein